MTKAETGAPCLCGMVGRDSSVQGVLTDSSSGARLFQRKQEKVLRSKGAVSEEQQGHDG